MCIRDSLPTIRKNGFYITDPLLQQFARDPDFAHAVVDALYEQSERVNEDVYKRQGYTILLCFTLFKTSSMARSIFAAH